MASGSQSPATARSGGKILKSRKTAARSTPYDRPIPPQPQQPALLQSESPSWLTGLVSPAKFVAGGATKILSSFWNPKTWASPSDTDSSESESEDDSGDEENPSDGEIELNQQQKGNSSQKSETLHLVEQLLMLEQFSREECDRLIEIINSRVVDYSTRDGADAGPSMIHSSTDNETHDIRNQAIMEAKKWVEENKFKSGLKSDLGNGSYGPKTVMTPQVTEGEAGSPIDVAKSYMKARPPWASPIDYDNSLTQSPLAADLFKERTPYSSGGGLSFSSAKRDYLSAGSWNIQEEIRRVRTKATEDMLSSHRSVKLSSKHSLINENPINAVGRDEPINLETPKSTDETVNLAEDDSTPGLSDIRAAQNDLPTETLPSHPTMLVLEQYQSHDEGNELQKEEDKRNPDQENNQTANNIDKNSNLMTESQELPIINNSQDSSNANDHRLVTKTAGTPVTRASRNTRKGKGRGK